MRKIATLVLFVSIVSLQNIAMAQSIDQVGNLTYSKSKYPANFILEEELKGHQSMVSDQKSDRTLAYKRYIEGNMTPADKSILKSCYRNNECKSGMVSAWKWTYEQRDYKIALYTAFVEVFQDKVNVAEQGTKPFDYIRTKYGESAYDWITKNQTLMDKAFDRYIGKERTAIANGKFSIVMDGERQTVSTYEVYVRYVWWRKLENYKAKAKTDLDRARVEYLEYRLLWDERLYLTN